MDGPPPQEEDFSAIPVSERLSHKNWKARVSGYESLIKTFSTTASDTDPAFKPYLSNPDLLRKIATDANAVAQEKGIECLVALVKYAGETAARTREAVVPALVDKCLGSSRAGTKNQAIELSLQYVEVENGGVGVVGDLLPGLGAKQPKTVAGCVAALKDIVRLFGIQTTPPPPILKALPKIFSHTDKTVRAEGTALAHALYQYMGPAIEPWLNDLKPVQVKELKEAFETMDKEGRGKGSLKPERLTRAQAREAETAGGDEEEPAQEEEEVLDPRAFAEPVDISGKIPPNAQLTSSKWKERKEAMDDFLTVLNSTPLLKDSPEYGDLVKTLAVRVQSDANINCVISAAGCIEGLAKGLSSSFGKFREAVIPPMLERLKERKANVTDAIGVALDAVFKCTTLPDVIPDLTPALSHKNPQVKEGTLKFLGRCLSTSKTPIATPQIKPLAESLASLLEDGFEGARNEAAVCLGTLMKMVGERPLGAVMDNIADIRKAKVKEVYEKATVKCKAGGPSAGPHKAAPPPAAKPAAKKAPLKVIETEETAPSPPTVKKTVAKPPQVASSKKPVTAAVPAVKKSSAPAAAAAPAKSSKAAPQTAGALDNFKYKHQPEDAEVLAAELIPASIMASLGDANWKTRLAALEEMTEWVENSVADLDAEVVVRALARKGWGEKNFQVSAKLYGLITVLAEKCPSFGRSCVALCVAHLTEKMGDLKLKKPAGDTLVVFAERTSLQFVLNQAYEPIGKQKAPKVIADAVTWINGALIDFGITGISLRALIDCLKTALQNSNAAVRTSATKTLVTVKLFAGSSIKDFVQDLNPQLLNTITAEFDKVEGNSAPEPSRTSADLANLAQPSGTSAGKAGNVGDPLDDLYPRVEIDGLLKGTTILADTKSDAWKTKKEALEALQAILDQGANKRLKPSMGEIGQVLKARVMDTNKAVQTLALDIVARIATGMGKPFEKQTRFFVQPVAAVLADQKAPIRAAALQTLTAIATACESLDSMVSGISSALETSNPLQKGTLLNWLVEWFKSHEPSSSLDLSTWASSIVTSLDDRNPEVRKGAQAILPALIACAGFDYVMQQTNSLKPASRNSAVPLVQEARTAATAMRPSTPAPAAPAAPKPPSPPPLSPTSPVDQPVKAAPSSKLTGVRRKLPLGNIPSSKSTSRPETPSEAPQSRLPSKLATGLKPPASIATKSQVAPPQQVPLAFHGTNMDAKKARLARDANRWINEGGSTRKDLADLLQSQMENHASKELVALLFSHDHNATNDHISGLAMMCEFYANAQGEDDIVMPVCLANLDFPLKYVSLKAHEPQPNLISKCLDMVDAMMTFLISVGYQLTDAEAQCFIPTIVHKLGDPREQTRSRVQSIIQDLPKAYAYSRVFQILLDNGLKSKVAKTRQGSLDELSGLLKKSGLGACDPPKALPQVAAMISDKDPQVRKSALNTLTEVYTLSGEKIWGWIGLLSPKDKTQLEERLRRVPGPSKHESAEPAPPSRTAAIRAGSPVGNPRRGIPRPASPSVSGASRIGRPASPSPHLTSLSRPASPSIGAASRFNRPASPSQRPASPTTSNHLVAPKTGSSIPGPASPGIPKPRSKLPSRLGRPASIYTQPIPIQNDDQHKRQMSNGSSAIVVSETVVDFDADADARTPGSPKDGDITVTISTILSSDPVRSVDALKKIQKILSVGPEKGPTSAQYRELAEHTEGLVETVTLQMAHVFDRPDELVLDENFRLAKHLIQTLNTFCDHAMLAESLTIDILTSLLEELTLRLLETDDSANKKVKDLSRFINMIILRLFATGRRMSIFRSLFALLLQIVKPFPANNTTPEAKEAKVAELVLKCVWKLARNLPQDLEEQKVDPVELFPAVEHFLQSVPPNEWRSRATNQIPCGDMPLRTIKVIIQHVVARYGDEVYDLLSASFDDPSATIVYPYVYRILNSAAKNNNGPAVGGESQPRRRSLSPGRPPSPPETSSSASPRNSSPNHQASPRSSRLTQELDPDAQLHAIIGHISSETTGALHKEGITELHQFLKAYPNKRQKVDKMLESTGPAFKKYISRALASRAAEDEERGAAVSDTLSKLEANNPTPPPLATSSSPTPRTTSPPPADSATQQKLSRLHNLFQYNRASVMSTHSAAERHSSES